MVSLRDFPPENRMKVRSERSFKKVLPFEMRRPGRLHFDFRCWLDDVKDSRCLDQSQPYRLLAGEGLKPEAYRDVLLEMTLSAPLALANERPTERR